MLKNTKDYEVLSKIADEINEQSSPQRRSVVNEADPDPDPNSDTNTDTNERTTKTNDPDDFSESQETDENSDSTDAGSQHTSSASSRKKGKKKNKNGTSTPSLKELAALKKSQNLVERKILLLILAILLGVQLLFMNGVVLLITLWSVFDWDVFRNLDSNVLSCIFDFTKYYVTAVLVELLGGIIYIVHRVFSDDK